MKTNRDIVIISCPHLSPSLYERLLAEADALSEAFDALGKAARGAQISFDGLGEGARRYIVAPVDNPIKPLVWYRRFEKKQRPRNSRLTGFG